ncbi:hypothetical protein GGR52DRAFT_218895 [Hypoxylon sp. FL1284]|nr:hypothetical protein GGR52DRAFT_218895 [Hypoxylon sp. FL1284]
MSYQLSSPQQPSQQEGGGYEYNGYTTYLYGQQTYAYPQQLEMAHAQQPYVQPSSDATMYYREGLARTQTWVASQPPVMTPPSSTKTPFSEWAGPADSSFDRRTLGASSAAMPPRPAADDARVCGVRRNTFFIVVAVAFFLLVVAVAVGLGAGLGTRKSSSVAVDSNPAALDSSSSSSLSSSTIAPTTTTSSTTPTSVKASPTPSFTGTLVPGPVSCPQDNGTVYVAQSSSRPFNVQCDIDYNSDDGSRDLTHMHTATMAECIDACGNDSGCVGVGWGVWKGSNRCWMKSKLGKPNRAPNWYFAQLQDMDSV